MCKLYFKGKLLSQHADYYDAEAQARWNYFEFYSKPWEGYNMPPGFLISVN